MRPKESGKVRYAYGVAMALLLGGTAFSLATGEAGAQVAQNDPGTAALAPRPGAPMSFADLTAKLAPAVVNISTKQRVPVKAQADPLEQFFRQFDPNQSQGGGSNDNGGGSGAQPRTREAGSLGSRRHARSARRASSRRRSSAPRRMPTPPRPMRRASARTPTFTISTGPCRAIS